MNICHSRMLIDKNHNNSCESNNSGEVEFTGGAGNLGDSNDYNNL